MQEKDLPLLPADEAADQATNRHETATKQPRNRQPTDSMSEKAILQQANHEIFHKIVERKGQES